MLSFLFQPIQINGLVFTLHLHQLDWQVHLLLRKMTSTCNINFESSKIKHIAFTKSSWQTFALQLFSIVTFQRKLDLAFMDPLPHPLHFSQLYPINADGPCFVSQGFPSVWHTEASADNCYPFSSPCTSKRLNPYSSGCGCHFNSMLLSRVATCLWHTLGEWGEEEKKKSLV